MSFTNFIRRKQGIRTPAVSNINVFETEKELLEHLDTYDAEKEITLTQEIKPAEVIPASLSEKIKAVFGFNKGGLSIEDHVKAIENMTKDQLDNYAEQYDIYLDRRRTKENMINEFIQKLKEKN
jgi:hypothetical protein